MKSLTAALIATTLWTTQTFAQDIQVVGKLQSGVPQPKQTFQANAITLPKSVTVMKIQLSEHGWSQLQEKTEAEISHHSEPSSEKISGGVQLGMNNVPVMDQGPHSTCVVFAHTAAISAALNKGDYFSELCQLQLGSYLEKNAYTLSGWNGSFGPMVLNQMQVFGVVTKETQRKLGCGGYTEYPTYHSEEPKLELSPTDYHLMSNPLPDQIGWSAILDAYHVFIDQVDPENTLTEVKKSLNAGDRLTFGILLFRLDQGIAGAVGKHTATNDSWVLTPEIIQSIESQDSEVGGHEMIITGYDDNAIAVDPHGQIHKGLLTLRNSWGEKLGDKGNFYMSYDYFKALAIEVQRIRNLY